MQTIPDYLPEIKTTIERLDQALSARRDLINPAGGNAVRLFSGFYEGASDLVVDQYGQTLVLFGYHNDPSQADEHLTAVQAYLLAKYDWVDCVIQKIRAAQAPLDRNGRLTFGSRPSSVIVEYGIRYALDLTMHQDASFYLDTRNLRRWLADNSNGLRVFNAFAYTGSLGIAALAGGAALVVQVDRSRKFLSLARRSGTLNRLDIGKMKLRAVDFFSEVSALKRRGEQFDCIIVDPPFFSTTQKGTVDLAAESKRVINKVRPLVVDGGYLVVVNNALFLSGEDFMRSLERLCQDGYLAIETLIPAPPDITGFPQTVCSSPPLSPSPFNHPTKMVVLKVRRKE